MEGARKLGAGALLDGSGAGAAASTEAVAGKRTQTMALDAHSRGDAAGGAPAAPATGAEAAAQMGPGQPLDEGARRAASAALGERTGDVQVHTGAAAAGFASGLGARAVAVGDHIAFGAGEYRPGTAEGDTLIAHEVAHTVQMKGADMDGPIGHGGAGAEREADEAADGIVRAQHGVPDEAAGRPAVSRQPLALHRDNKAPKPDPVKAAALKLADEIAKEVADSTRDAVRNRLYAKHSAPNAQLARDRRAGKVPDLTGLGSKLMIDEMVRRFRSDLLPFWADKGMNARERALRTYMLAQAMLVTVGVPQFAGHDIVDMKPKGAFTAQDWRFKFQKQMMENASPSKDEQGDLINAVAHESRHAEQAWFAARLAAGKKLEPKAIVAALGVTPDVAKWAKDAPLTAKTATPAELAFATAMFDAEATHGAQNMKLEAAIQDRSKDLVAKNAACAAAVAQLRKSPTAAQMTATTKARDEMRAAVTAYTDAYRDYRGIPFEADAHEVGDAAVVAFRENP